MWTLVLIPMLVKFTSGFTLNSDNQNETVSPGMLAYTGVFLVFYVYLLSSYYWLEVSEPKKRKAYLALMAKCTFVIMLTLLMAFKYSYLTIKLCILEIIFLLSISLSSYMINSFEELGPLNLELLRDSRFISRCQMISAVCQISLIVVGVLSLYSLTKDTSLNAYLGVATGSLVLLHGLSVYFAARKYSYLLIEETRGSRKEDMGTRFYRLQAQNRVYRGSVSLPLFQIASIGSYILSLGVTNVYVIERSTIAFVLFFELLLSICQFSVFQPSTPAHLPRIKAYPSFTEEF